MLASLFFIAAENFQHDPKLLYACLIFLGIPTNDKWMRLIFLGIPTNDKWLNTEYSSQNCRLL
jgi:hypothetical protein